MSTTKLLTSQLQEKITKIVSSTELVSKKLLDTLAPELSQLSFREKGQMFQEVHLMITLLRAQNPDDKSLKLYELLAKNLEDQLIPAKREAIPDGALGFLVNRDHLAQELARNRSVNGKAGKNDGIPIGELELQKGKIIRIEDQKFFDIFSKKYQDLLVKKYKNQISVKDFENKISKLDTEFAELIIIENTSNLQDVEESEIGNEEKGKLWIQINNEELNIGDKYYKSEAEIIENAKDCEASLKKMGYNVEYVVLTQILKEYGKEKKHELHIVRTLTKKPDTEKPDTEKPDTEKPDTEKPDTEKPDTEKPDAEKPDTEKPDTEKPDTEKPDTEKPDTEKPDTEKPDTEKPDTEKPDTEKPDTEKLESISRYQETLLVNRDNLANTIAKNRDSNGRSRLNKGFPFGEIELQNGRMIILQNQNHFAHFQKKYEELLDAKESGAHGRNFEKEFKELDTQFAEMIIIENKDLEGKNLWIQINNDANLDVSDPNNKSEKEIIETAKRCESSLKKLGYDVEYVVLTKNMLNRSGERFSLIQELDYWKKKYDELKSELDSKRLHYNEIERRTKEEELLKLEKKIGELQHSLSLLEKEVGNGEKKYHIVRLKQDIDTPPPPPIPDPDSEPKKLEPGEINAVLSNTLNIHQENARLYAEEALKNEYHQVSKWNLLKKGQLFFQRGKMRKKLIEAYMQDASNKAFTVDQRDDELTRGANRHSLEKLNTFRHSLENLNTFGSIKELTTTAIEIPEVNDLASRYIAGALSADEFKHLFNAIAERHPQIQSELQKGNIEYFSTNILENLNVEKAQLELMEKLSQTLVTGGNIDQIKQEIQHFILTYQQNPIFLAKIQSYLEKGDLEELKKYFNLQNGYRKQLLENLHIKLHVLDQGKSAYQIDNSKNEKGWLYKLGHKLDKIPWYYQVPAYAGLGVLVGATGGAMGMGVVAASALKIGVFAGTTGFMNFVKKRTHYTKEHNTHEKNRVTANNTEKEKVMQWQRDLTAKGAKSWFKRHKAKRQLELYNDATHTDIESTTAVAQDLLALVSSVRTLDAQDKALLASILVQTKARLDAYQRTGHNFFASDKKDSIEQDMNLLWKTLQLGAEKLGIGFSDIDQLSTIDGDPYSTVVKELEMDYDNANRKFRKERGWLATKYGLTTAAISAGFAVVSQAVMGNGIFSTDSETITNITSSTAGGVDYYGMGAHEIIGAGSVESSTASAMSALQPGATAHGFYGAGTDFTGVRFGSILNTPEHYAEKIASITKEIGSLSLTEAQKASFMAEIASKPWESVRGNGFTNDYLMGDRCLEGLKEMAQGLASSGNAEIIPNLTFDSTRSIAGQTAHNASERIFSGVWEIKNPISEVIAGSGQNTRFIPFGVFYNTFKRNPDLEEDKKQDDKSEKKDKKIERDPDAFKDFGPKPVDPEKDPDDVFRDNFGKDPKKKSLKGKKKIVTRGQFIEIRDKRDLGKEYPGSGELQSADTTAHYLLMDRKKLSSEDAKVVNAMESKEDAHNYLKKIILQKREEAAIHAEKWSFQKLLDQCYESIPKYLNTYLGDELASKLNALPDKKRVHLVSDYDYMTISNSRTCGVFRSESGDIYISESFLKQKENNPPLGEIRRGNEIITFPRIFWEIKHILIHELLHSMSVINYEDFNKENENNPDLFRGKRIGLGNVDYERDLLRGRNINEATTEHLTQYILRQIYEEEGLLDYKAPWVSYFYEQRIVHQLVKTEGLDIERKDFYKAMLLRKTKDEPGKVEINTPLYELIAKCNGLDESKKITRPSYYQLIMDLLDAKAYKEAKEFIDKNDINILRNATSLSGSLSKYFDKKLLNKEGTDFNQEILDAYTPNGMEAAE